MKGQEYPTFADWVGEVLEGIIALFDKTQLLNWQETSKRRIFWEVLSIEWKWPVYKISRDPAFILNQLQKWIFFFQQVF